VGVRQGTEAGDTKAKTVSFTVVVNNQPGSHKTKREGGFLREKPKTGRDKAKLIVGKNAVSIVSLISANFWKADRGAKAYPREGRSIYPTQWATGGQPRRNPAVGHKGTAKSRGKTGGTRKRRALFREKRRKKRHAACVLGCFYKPGWKGKRDQRRLRWGNSCPGVAED